VSGFQPTGEQEQIRDAYLAGGPLAVTAGAGTGKTSTLVMLGEARQARARYIAYNKSIAMEAERKFPRWVRCSTSHSLAYASAGARFRHRLDNKRHVPAKEVAKILGINEPVPLPGGGKLSPVQVARLAMETLQRFCYSADPEPSAVHAPFKKGLNEPAVQQALREVLVPLARRAWADACDPDGKLKYQHDWYIKWWQLSDPRIDADVLFVDEAQDCNPVLDWVIARQDAQVIAVGDSCQPPGTLVRVVRSAPKGTRWTGTLPVVTEEVPIEQLREGDQVVSFDQAHSYLRRSGSPVTGITARPYSGDLVVVQAGDLSSRYTPDHHCIVRFGAELAEKHVVYLMRRGSDYRIGITGGRLDSQYRRIGVTIRAVQEAADAMWILSVHDSRGQAALAEIMTAWDFGIPTVTFRSGNNNTMTQDQLDRFWGKLGGNRDAAAAALSAHGRSIEFPLWDSTHRSLQTRRPTVVRACNLIDGMEVLPLGSAMMAGDKRCSAWRWERISVSRTPYTGPVYSLTVDRDHTYVGDGIITHNCQAIYGWRGATDALDRLGQGSKLSLSRSFRFGPAIAAEANKWLGLLDADLRLSGTPSVPSRLGEAAAPKAILCRSNAGVMKQVIAEIGAGRKTAIPSPRPGVAGGGEIERLAKAAISLKRGLGTDHPELMAFQNWSEVRDYAENDPGGEDLLVLVELIDEHTPEKILAMCAQLVEERYADVVVSTAHKAKGREWESVQIADFRKPRKAPDEDEAPPPSPEQMMLAYVAVTRAKVLLDRGPLSFVDDYLYQPAAGGAR
jgi:hypothetical protein